MIERIIRRMSVSLIGALFALSFVTGANAVSISPGGATNNIIDGTEVFTADSGLSAGGAPFDHTYTFDVKNSGQLMSASMDVIQEPPDLNQGIADLTYLWADGGGSILNLVVTNSTGFRCNGSNGCVDVGSLPFLFSHLFSTGIFTIQVTGTTLALANSDYSLVLVSVPLPAAALLFGSALLGGGLMRRRKMIKKFGLPA